MARRSPLSYAFSPREKPLNGVCPGPSRYELEPVSLRRPEPSMVGKRSSPMTRASEISMRCYLLILSPRAPLEKRGVWQVWLMVKLHLSVPNIYASKEIISCTTTSIPRWCHSRQLQYTQTRSCSQYAASIGRTITGSWTCCGVAAAWCQPTST